MTTMTRPHFVLIADVIKTHDFENPATDPRTRRMAIELAKTNPNFNRERFLRACGVEG